ncbi:T9SS type A sorting domain-containing protein [Ferruginibacter sp.]
MKQILPLICKVPAIALLFVLLSNFSAAQLPGFINRQATSVAGRAVLDPNSDGYTSTTTAGFGTNDVANSELLFNGIKAYPVEPFGDLTRGPNHNFSDFVPDSSGSGVYYKFTAAQQVIFRMRMGSIMPGSKGYSILMDTDGKFGASGTNADPNYLPATTGVNGNPGFEIEIVLETNFRIAIYNVDGTSSPVLVKQYTNWQDMSQVSVASTNDNGDPDFLIDFYIPFSDLQAAPFNLTAASTIRMTATTVMSPQAAIGGPRSDIYGTAGSTYEDFINGQPACSIFTTTPSCPSTMCTAAPVVNTPIGTGIVNISGNWTKSLLTGAATTATITVYKNGIAVGTVANVSSGSTWTLNSVVLVNGDVITAKAQGIGESMCLISNALTASTCAAANIPATPILSCTSGSKGVSGTNLATGWLVHVDNITRNVLDNSVSNLTGLFGSLTGTTPNINWLFSGGCSSGAPLTSGSYKIYYTDIVTGCNSLPAYFCAAGNGGSALAGTLAVPVITSPVGSVFTTATKTISGTTDANATVYLYINGINVQTVTATGGIFSFTNLNLLQGQQLYIAVELNTGVVTTSKCENQTGLFTVGCFTLSPLVSADNNNQLTAGAAITGTSTEPAGTTIRVYTAAAVLVATTTVQANGSWSTGNAGTTPATYNAVAGTSYYATAQNGTCGASTNSASFAASTATAGTRCGTISGAITAGTGSISGTLTGSFTTTTVNLYLDGQVIGSTTTNNTAWGPITVNTTVTNTLYSNGVLSIGVQESSKQETGCPLSAVTIQCTPTPTAPAYSISSGSVNQYQTITVNITNAVTGTFYALADSATGLSLGQGKWAIANGNLSLLTDAFNTAGTYKVKVNATSMSGVTLCSAGSATATVVVNPVILPLYLSEFSGRKDIAGNLLEWVTENEVNVKQFIIEHSTTSNNFTAIGKTTAAGTSAGRNNYSFTDATPATGLNYYRLKMVDNNGAFTYSNMVIINNSSTANIMVSSAAPNPFTEKIVLTVVLNKAAPLTLQVMDYAGRIYLTKNAEGRKGVNKIELDGLAKLAQGIYTVKISDAVNILQQKIVKLR